MSNQYQRKLSLAGVDVSLMSLEELGATVKTILENRIHGISFSPYLENQAPGIQLQPGPIRERLRTIQPWVQWVRTFSCKDGNQLTPGIAAASGLKTMVGVWLDEDREANEIELANAIEVARAGHADILAVGNEVLLRGELSEDELLEYLRRA